MTLEVIPISLWTKAGARTRLLARTSRSWVLTSWRKSLRNSFSVLLRPSVRTITE